jgi:hypothetical protein
LHYTYDAKNLSLGKSLPDGRAVNYGPYADHGDMEFEADIIMRRVQQVSSIAERR